MRKRFGLAVVGFAIAFGVASRLASHFRDNQPFAVLPMLVKQPGQTNSDQPKVTAFPTTGVLVNHSINRNPALDFNPAEVRRQISSQVAFNDSKPSIRGNGETGGRRARKCRTFDCNFGSDSAISEPASNRQMYWWNGNSHLTNLALQLSPYPIATFLYPEGIQTTQFSSDKLYAQTPSQDIPPSKDGERFRRIMQSAIAQKLHQRPMGDILQAIATTFVGAPYKGNLLDQSTEETLVVNLNQFDCVLLVETVLAIARGVAVQDYSYTTFVNHLRDQRYWNGQIDGYCSRLHYFSQWIYDNQKRGTVQNLGLQLGSVALNKRLNFMSTHRQNYPPMVKNDVNYQCLMEREAQIDGVTIDYIPTNKIRSLYSQLQPGDIIAVATNIPGLDVTHTGLAYRQPNGNIGFIHASPAGQVTIARDVHRYTSRVKHAIGILVIRPLDPRQTKTADNTSPNF